MHILSGSFFINLLFTNLLNPCVARSPSCDVRTKPPIKPSFQDCQTFLWNLAQRSHKDPQAYRWYGRHLDACPECAKLPTIMHWKNLRCAALIDVDDADEREIAVFGLDDLWKALSNMVGKCWLKENHNGRGYPSGAAVWAALTVGVNPNLEVSLKAIDGKRSQENKTLNVLNLDELYP